MHCAYAQLKALELLLLLLVMLLLWQKVKLILSLLDLDKTSVLLKIKVFSSAVQTFHAKRNYVDSYKRSSAERLAGQTNCRTEVR